MEIQSKKSQGELPVFKLKAKAEQTQTFKDNLVSALIKENQQLNKVVLELQLRIEVLEAKEPVAERCDSPLIYGVSEN